MKLDKENFKKEMDGSIVRYCYTCNDTNFYLELIGQNKDRNIKVFKGNLAERQDELTTTDSLKAWNYFEELLTVCQSEQGSSGGGNLGKNPEQNPNIIPLMAIGHLDSDNFRKITLFVVKDDGEQVKLFDFKVNGDTMPQPLPTSVFKVDWSNEDISQIIKCEVILKQFDVKFEEDPDKKVFLFIPKSIGDQGGEQGGNTEEGGNKEGGNEDGEPTNEKGDKERKNKDQKAKPTNEDGEPTNEDGEPTNEDGEPTNEKGDKERKNEDQKPKPTDEKGDEKADVEDGEPTNQKPKPSKEDPKDGEKKEDNVNAGLSGGKARDFSNIVSDLARITNNSPSSLLSIFRTPRTTELWLTSNNFQKIKQDLNLPKQMTASELSKQIINSK
jgi:hypothetical protein